MIGNAECNITSLEALAVDDVALQHNAIPRRTDRWRWNVILRGDDPVTLLDGDMAVPWSVDVDPESLL